MDLGNLEKLKVVDLRNELQKRGLDTKGVKAVLIDRLRTYLSGGFTTATGQAGVAGGVGGGLVGIPYTPSRRSRRTKSMTRSPSPSSHPPAKKSAETILETLPEESLQQTTQAAPTIPTNIQPTSIPKVNLTRIDASIDLTAIDSSPEHNRNSPDVVPQTAANTKQFVEVSAIPETSIKKVDAVGVVDHPSHGHEQQPEQIKETQLASKTVVDDEINQQSAAENARNLSVKDEFLQHDVKDDKEVEEVKDVIEVEEVKEVKEVKEVEEVEKIKEGEDVKEETKVEEEQVVLPVGGDEMWVQIEAEAKEPETVEIEMTSVAEDKVLSDEQCQPVAEKVLEESMPDEMPSSVDAVDQLQQQQQQEEDAAAINLEAADNAFKDYSAATENPETIAEDLSINEPQQNQTVNKEQTVSEELQEMEGLEQSKNESHTPETMNNEQTEQVEQTEQQVEETKETEQTEQMEDVEQSEQIEQIENSDKLEKSDTMPEEEDLKKSTQKDEIMETEMQAAPITAAVTSISSNKSPSSRGHSRSPRQRDVTDSDSSAPEDEPSIEDYQYGLSWFDSDIHLRIDPVTFTSARPMNQDIYALVWSGARANYGVREGKVCYEVRLSEENYLGRSHEFRDEPYVRGFRVGFSLVSTTLLLGEEENSFAYCENGRKVVNNNFSTYGKPYELDDVIGCYLDLDSTPCTIRYTLNGMDLGVAFEFDRSIFTGDDEALFPHILTKGYEYQLNFADNDNLLVNVERKTRKKRKLAKKRSPSKEDVNKSQKTITEEKNGMIEQQDDGTEEVQEQQTAGEETENQTQMETETETEAETTETETESKMATEMEVEEEKMDKPPSTTETPTEIRDSSISVEEEKENLVEKSSIEMEGKTNCITDDGGGGDKEIIETAIDENDNENGPSPTKRAKLDSAVQSEDEYEEYHPIPREHMSLLADYELIALIPEEKYIAGPQRPQTRKECEVILMVGLPGSGKTTWVMNHIKENPNKRYHVIGADALVAKMTVDGVPRETVHKGRFERVYELAYNILTTLEDIAVKRRRNFILDQTNVYASAQRRKMKGFSDLKRIAVVCLPNDEELKRRLASKKEKGFVHTLKESTLNSIQASFSLPSLEFGWFDEIIYSDLNGNEARDEVKRLNEIGKKASYAYNSVREKPRQRPRDNYRNDNNRRRYDDRRRYDQRNNDQRNNEQRWNRGGNYHHNHHHHHHQYGSGGGGGGGAGGGTSGGSMMGNRWAVTGGGHHYGMNSGYRDDRNHHRGYDHRTPGRFAGVNSGPMIPPSSNWMSNNRHGRFDDRQNRYNNSTNLANSNRYDNYGGSGGNLGGGGGSRNYRSANSDYRENRDQRNNSNNTSSNSSRSNNNNNSNNNGRRDNSNYHRNSSGGSGSGSGSGSMNNQQRDFRHGHRDTREDSRGGRASVLHPNTNNKYNIHSTQSNDVNPYNPYNKSMMGGANNTSGNWKTYGGQHSNQHNLPAMQRGNVNDWQQCPTQNQQYWNYGSQGYGHDQEQQQQQQHQAQDQQQHWHNLDANQQQQWMAWWQQQQQQQQGAGAGNETNTTPTDSNHYWIQYGYNNSSDGTATATQTPTAAAAAASGDSTGDSISSSNSNILLQN